MVKVKTLAGTKAEAYRIERAIVTAIGSGDHEFLDAASRSVCMKLFRNQQLELPPGLCRTVVPTEEPTLWKAAEKVFKYPEIRKCSNLSCLLGTAGILQRPVHGPDDCEIE